MDISIHSTSLAQRLPQELITTFLQPLCDEYRPRPYFMERYENTERTAAAVQLQRSFCLLLQVCRSWSIAGRKLLYTAPCLYSGILQLDRFIRTLKANSELPGLVQEIYLQLILGLKYPFHGLIFDSTHVHIPLLVGERQYLLEIARLCTSCVGLVLNQHREGQIRESALPFPNVSSPDSIANRLQTLTLYGAIIYDAGSGVFINSNIIFDQGTQHILQMTFPKLENLTITSSSFYSRSLRFNTPNLKKLHISSSTGMSVTAGQDHPILRGIEYPKLESLELDRNGFSIRIDDDCLKTLKRLSLSSTMRGQLLMCTKLFTTSSDILKHSALERLTLGFDDLHENDLPSSGSLDLTFPSAVRSLSVNVHSKNAGVILQMIIHNLLMANRRSSLKLKTLSIRILLLRPFDAAARDGTFHVNQLGFTDTMRKLKELCTERGIELKIDALWFIDLLMTQCRYLSLHL
ncbi:hypothetical protein C8Q75DRAFT_743650 [Abortiporus biennis]|nr:hypothetical protein C8Q75DRAFT_743650 [Abortiporus biennis]